jgi:DNA-binding MarR family transcriptional regulator
MFVRLLTESDMVIFVGLSETQVRILKAVKRLQPACASRGLPIRAIAREADVSYETVKLHLTRMEACGCLKRRIPPTPSRGRPYRYEVLVDVPDTPAYPLA